MQDMTGEKPDIYEYLGFGSYDHVSYKDNARIGMTGIVRWLGVSHKVGGLMSYYILTQKGAVRSRTIVQRLASL